MASVNEVTLIGNLTRDPELRHTPNGAAVCDIGLACNRRSKGKDGEWKEEVTFIDVTTWNRTAENVAQYLKKGRPVYIKGYLKLDSWEDKKTGEKRSKLKVEALDVQFLGGKDDGGGSRGSGGGQRPERNPAPQSDDEDVPF